jgi:putative zinc finger protein
MQCRDVRELADSFLSEQLLVETNHELLRHLETCPECRAEIAGRRGMRDTLRSAWLGAEDLQPRPEFAAELAATLRPSRAGMSRRSALRWWWTMAAGVVLAAGGGVLVRDARSRSRLAALARAAAGDHQNCALRFNLRERPISLDEAGRRYGAPYVELATLELPAIDGSLETIERHACVYQARRFGHLVSRFQGVPVSLLITDGVPPNAAELQPSDGGHQVAALPAGRFLGFVVADLAPPQILRLAQSVVEPLSKHLTS